MSDEEFDKCVENAFAMKDKNIMSIRVKHPMHGMGNIIERVDDFTVVVKYDTETTWGNPIWQSECELEKI